MGDPKFFIFRSFPLISGHFAPVVDSRDDRVGGTVRFRRDFWSLGATDAGCHGCRTASVAWPDLVRSVRSGLRAGRRAGQVPC